MKRILISIMVLSLSLFFVACGGSDKKAEAPKTEAPKAEAPKAETPKTEAPKAPEVKANVLNFAMTVDPDGLDPQRTVAASTFQITNNIYDTLVKVNSDGSYRAGLAKEWKLSDDGKEITFTLQTGVKFHNGNDFNAKSVVSSFERLKEEGSPRAKDYANIVKVEAISDTQVKFTTEKLDVELVSQFAYPWAAIVDVSAKDTLKNKPVGTGAYMLEEWVIQQKLTLKKYDGAVEKANIDKIVFKVIPDAAARVSAFKAGELDIMAISGDLVKQFEGADYTIAKNPTNALQLMAMNNKNQYLSNAKVREAITYAIDKDSLIQNIWNGYGLKIGSHFPPVLPGYVDHSKDITPNLEKAKSLMKEAGYEKGFKLDMYLPKNYQSYVDAGQVIANDLKAINIECNVVIVEWAAWLEDVYKGRKYDLTVVGHTGRLDPFVLLARYDSKSGENYFNYSNAKIDEILKNVKQEKDGAKRTAMYAEVQAILAKEVPALYIQTPYNITVMKKNVSGFKTFPIDIYELKDLKLN